MNNIVIDIFLFLALPVFMGSVCIFIVNPKGDNRNSGAGYRTKRSMESPENWNLANRTFGYCSIAILIPEIIALLLEHKYLIPRNLLQAELAFYINILILFAGVAAGIVVTEFRLRKKK